MFRPPCPPLAPPPATLPTPCWALPPPPPTAPPTATRGRNRRPAVGSPGTPGSAPHPPRSTAHSPATSRRSTPPPPPPLVTSPYGVPSPSSRPHRPICCIMMWWRGFRRPRHHRCGFTIPRVGEVFRGWSISERRPPIMWWRRPEPASTGRAKSKPNQTQKLIINQLIVLLPPAHWKMCAIF